MTPKSPFDLVLTYSRASMLAAKCRQIRQVSFGDPISGLIYRMKPSMLR